MVINDDVWNDLPQDIRTALNAASQAASSYSTDTTLREEQEIIDRLRKGGVTVTRFDAAARTESDARTQPMYEEYYKGAGDNGRALLKYVRSLK